MSKWVPSVVRNQQQGTTSNYFDSLVNTSLPAKEAPKLAPATLASLTSKNGVVAAPNNSVTGSKKSYAEKFVEKERIANDPTYVAPPKEVNFNSEDDFPSLGGAKTTVKPVAAAVRPVENKPVGSSFADLAKGWATKKAREEEKARRKALRAEQRRREMELMRNMPTFNLMRRRREEDGYDEEQDYNPTYEEDEYLAESDSFEMSDHEDDMPEDEQDDDEEEFNPNAVWDGRRRDDLY